MATGTNTKTAIQARISFPMSKQEITVKSSEESNYHTDLSRIELSKPIKLLKIYLIAKQANTKNNLSSTLQPGLTCGMSLFLVNAWRGYC